MSLPPVGWADVATRHDLAAEAALVKSELRLEIGALRAEIGAVEHRLGGRIDDLRAEFHSTLRQEIRSLLHWTVGTVLGTVFGGLLAAVVAIVQLT